LTWKDWEENLPDDELEIERIVGRLPRPRLRRIAELKLAGLTWAEVALRVYRRPKPDRARKEMGRYLASLKK
jgi:hypothetical protein